jgi:hypothetical protein
MSYTVKLDALGQIVLTEGSDKRYITIEQSDQTITDSAYHLFDIGNTATVSFSVADTGAGYVFCKCDTLFSFGDNSATTTMNHFPADGFALMAFTNAQTFYVYNHSTNASQGVIGFWLT